MSTVPGPLSDGTRAFPFDPPLVGDLGERRWHSIAYSCDAGYRPLFLDLRVPASASEASPAPVVVWVHGGGWVHGSRRRQSPNLHAHRVLDRIVGHGFAVAVLDYRLAKEAAFPAPLMDIRASVRWLRGNAAEFCLDPNRIALWGESAGAHLVTMAAFCDRLDPEPRSGEHPEQSEDVQAVVEWYGPADLALFETGPVTAESDERGLVNEHPLATLVAGSGWTAAQLSPISYARVGIPPVFIAHGTEDQQVPVEQSRMLYGALLAAGAHAEYLETIGDHVFVTHGEPILPHVTDRSLDFLKRHLNRPGASAAGEGLQAVPQRRP